jgi:hypothetical protein
MIKRYKIKTLTRTVRDEASVRFHVASDDYFGTLATILSLLKQDIKKSGRSDSGRLLAMLKDLENDLIFLQKNYRVSPRLQTKPKTKNKKMIPKGRLISQ